MAHVKERRRTPRRITDGRGTYFLVAYPELGWNECQLIDVSVNGAGLRIEGPGPLVGEEILLLVDLWNRFGAPVHGLELTATVRNVRHRGCSTRVGLEFCTLDERHTTALDSLLDAFV
jgi:hypothetical protein